MSKLDKEQYSKAEVEEMLRVSTEEVTEKLDAVTQVAEMTDSHKELYGKLSGDAKDQFLFASKDEREDIVKGSVVEDPVIYKAEDGSEFRKSDDPRLVIMAKKNDANEKRLRKSEEARETARLEKRAEDEFTNVPGTLETRVAMIKSLEAIEDEDVRKAAFESLKAQNAKMGESFQVIGADGQPVIKGKGDAEAELEQLAKDYAIEKSIGFVEAYGIVSDQQPDLYSKAVNGQ